MARKRKKVPSYWWDFQGKNIIVESDDDRFPCVGVFPFRDTGAGCAAAAIQQADALIADLNAGRKTPVFVPCRGVRPPTHTGDADERSGCDG